MKSERARLTERLDTLCREIVRLRDDNRCQICGKHVEGSNSQPCHVVAKGRGASLRRFDLLNIFLGCMHDHQWWHLNPLDSTAWFRKRFTIRYAYLETYRGGKPCKISTQEMRDLEVQLKQKYKELQNETV